MLDAPFQPVPEPSGLLAAALATAMAVAMLYRP
jgi:hypothetical protein